MENHECFQHLTYNEDSKGSGYEDFLICEICGETYQQHRYVCWVRPYPHLSDKLIEKLLNIIGFDFTDDIYGETDITDDVKRQYPELYKDIYGCVESKGSYFYEFSDNETYELLETKLEKLKRYCSGWCQYNM